MPAGGLLWRVRWLEAFQDLICRKIIPASRQHDAHQSPHTTELCHFGTVYLNITDKTVLSWDQLRAVLFRLGRCDRIVLELEMTNALRPSELFGLKWKCFDPATSSIKIEETTYKGKIRPWGKTKGSLATIPIASDLAEEL